MVQTAPQPLSLATSSAELLRACTTSSLLIPAPWAIFQAISSDIRSAGACASLLITSFAPYSRASLTT